MSHRRYNPLLDEWVLCSPGRLERPWQGETSPRDAPRVPSYDPDCYICPRNLRAGGRANPDYTGAHAFDNDFPALGASDPPEARSDLLAAEPATGRCRVLSFSPRHDAHLGAMTPGGVREVVDAWASETEELHSGGARYVQVFENRGGMMGASNPHPHGQIWGVDYVPTLPAKKRETQRAHFEKHGRQLLGDYLEAELDDGTRIVETNDHWVHLVPFWAVWPFETLLVPRRPVATLPELDEDERESLAALLGSLVRRYDDLFDTAFPYSMGWYQRPEDGGPDGGCRLHAVYLPPLLRSATIRKYLVGFELTSEPQRDLTPEDAAERLRR